VRVSFSSARRMHTTTSHPRQSFDADDEETAVRQPLRGNASSKGLSEASYA